MPPLSPWEKPSKRACFRCDGRGVVGFWRFRRECRECGGKGWYYGYGGREWKETDHA